MEDALKKTGLKATWLMNVVSLNVPHVPWNDDHRWNETRDLMRKRARVLRLLPEEDALLEEYTPRIHHEMVTYDHAICARSDRDAFVRDAIKARSTGAALKGYQCNFNCLFDFAQFMTPMCNLVSGPRRCMRGHWWDWRAI